jgi:hypothetical protein
VLRRRRAAGTTAADHVRLASAVATRSGAAGHDRNNRGSQVLIAAISGRVIRIVGKTPGGVDARRMSRGEPLDRRGSASVRTEGPAVPATRARPINQERPWIGRRPSGTLDFKRSFGILDAVSGPCAKALRDLRTRTTKMRRQASC